MMDRASIDGIKRNFAMIESELRNAGAKIRGSSVCCPFHDDKAPSGGLHEAAGSWLYTCHVCTWNDGKRSGDVFAVVKAARGLDFESAVRHLGGDGGRPTTAPRPLPQAESEGPSAADAQAQADADHARLLEDDQALRRLWESRVVSSEIVAKFRIGMTSWRSHWTLPISDGRFIGVKHHRATDDASPKCFWAPKGARSRNAWPIALDGSGPVWVVGGELKALGIASIGLPAIGITGGESAELPSGITSIVQGRPVAIVGDDDKAGREWADKALAVFTEADVDARIIDIGLDTAAGMNDVGDWLRANVIDRGDSKDATRKALLNEYERSGPWNRFRLGTILRDSDTWRPDLRINTGMDSLQSATGGGLRLGGVNIVSGRPGSGKTQTVVQIASNVARGGVPVGIISLEMSEAEIARLMIAQLTGISRAIVSAGPRALTEPQKVEIAAAILDLEKWPAQIFSRDAFRPRLSRKTLTDLVRDGCRRHGWKLVVLDYIGLLGRDGTESQFDADIGISTMLKSLASENMCCILGVAALRKSYGHTNGNCRHVGSIDDLAGAGRLAYDVENVFLADCEQPNADSQQGVGRIFLSPLKTRFGAAGSSTSDRISLRWFPACGRVDNFPDKGGD